MKRSKCKAKVWGIVESRGARNGGVETMAMPQRDDPPSRCALRRTSTIEVIKRLDACGCLRTLRVRRWRISQVCRHAW